MDANTMAQAMKAYKPRRPKTTADDAISSEEKKRLLQEARDAKDRQGIQGMGYAKGGSVSKRADGIAQRGKTNCKIC